MALSATDIEPVAHESRDRIITGTVTVVPMLAWEGLLRPGDDVVFAVFYVLTGLGVTVGLHRHFTHRSFQTKRPIRLLAVLGSAAIEGPVISWVADHRKHHAFSDRAGDPHSPHVDHGAGWRVALRGLAHAHVGVRSARVASGALGDRSLDHGHQSAIAAWLRLRAGSRAIDLRPVSRFAAERKAI